MKGDFPDTKLHLRSFDLYPCLVAAADEGFIEVIQLFQRICSCSNVITIYCKFISQCLGISLVIEGMIAIGIFETVSQRSVFFIINVLVQSFQVGSLLDCRRGLCSHEQSVPAVQTSGGVESCEQLAFLAHRYAPIGVGAICLQVILLSMQLGNLISRQRYRASHRLKAFVYEGVHTYAEAMICIILFLSRCELGHDDQPRNAPRWVNAFLHDRSAINEPVDDLSCRRFSSPVHGFDLGEVLFPSCILRE